MLMLPQNVRFNRYYVFKIQRCRYKKNKKQKETVKLLHDFGFFKSDNYTLPTTLP